MANEFKVKNGIKFPDNTIQTTASTGGSGSAKTYVTRRLTSGTTYTTPSGVVALYVFVSGAIGGQSSRNNPGGRGGPGYSELYISSPAASYTYAIGAGGSSSGTAGGTTTWGGVISVTGSSGVTGSAGSAGGAGSGGNYNSTGGSGGASASSNSGGGGGGAGSRAGNGGNGAGTTSTPAGGGSGGNNASGGTAGIAATAKAAGASTLSDFLIFQESFNAGSTATSYAQVGACCVTTNYNVGGSGAPNNFNFNGAVPGVGNSVTLSGILGNGGVGGSAAVGNSGVIVVVEVYNQ